MEKEKAAAVPEAKAATVPSPTATTPPIDPAKEPNKEENYQAWLEWKLAQTDVTTQQQQKLIDEFVNWRADQQKEAETQAKVRSATDEFAVIQQAYAKENPDYDNAVGFARAKYADSVKMLYPQMNDAQIKAAIDHQILLFASECVGKGLNPAEEVYDMAIERFGYVKQEPKPKEEEEPKPRAETKPSLKTIANNKKRSATPLTGGGQGGSIPLTPEIVNDMSLGEFSRLTPDQLAMLESM